VFRAFEAAARHESFGRERAGGDQPADPAARTVWRFTRHHRSRWLDNRVEQDHRRVKRRTRPMLGFQGFWTARRTLAGVEAMAMLAKGQVRAAPANDVPAQRAFVASPFGLAA
jgi:transposase, IS6 family